MQFSIQQLNNLFKNKLKNVYSNSEIQQLRFMVYETLLGVPKLDAITNPEKIITSDKYKQLEKVAERLAGNEPIQYILGETEFFDLRIKVSPSVLIPRPETEELLSWILSDCKAPKLRVLDIGTGSGCIAIALAKHMNNAKVFGIDISHAALEIASENASINKAEVNFIEHNILEVEAANLPNMLDVLVSNPPYIRENEKTLMKANVLDYEPELALFVPNHKPLLFYEKIAQLGTYILKKGGFLYFEINEAMGLEMENLLHHLKYKNIEIRKDFDGKNRMVKAIL